MDPGAARRPKYTADSIKVRTLQEVVRARPIMYFGRAREDPALISAVARAAVLDAFVLPPVGAGALRSYADYPTAR